MNLRYNLNNNRLNSVAVDVYGKLLYIEIIIVNLKKK